MDEQTLSELLEKYKAANEKMGLDFAIGTDNPIDLLLVIDKLKLEYFTLKDTRVSARVLNHWKNNKILPLIRTGGWNKFSLIELIWIDIVIALREFGLSLQKISKVRDQLFQPIKLEKDTQDVDIDKFYEAMYLKHKRIFTFNMLAGITGNMLISRKPVLITVLQNGMCSINDTGNFKLYDVPFVTIPLFPIIQFFILDHKNREKMMDLGMITREEQLIIDHIRQGNIKSLTIKFTEDNEIHTIEAKTKIDIEKLQKQVGGIIAKGAYQKIEIQGESGNIVYATRDEKIYYKNK